IAVTNLYTEGGNDTILISLMAGSDGAFTFEPGDGDDTVNASLFSSGISDLPDSTMPLIIMGMSGSDHLTGGAGNDVLIGDNGIAMYKGGELWKIFTIKSNDGDADYLEGGEGNDVLLGGEGHDTIMGEPSADILIANYGKVVFKNGKVVSILPSLDMIPGSILYEPEKGIPVIEGAGPVRFGEASHTGPSKAFTPFGEQKGWGFYETAHHPSYILSGSGFQGAPGESTEEGIQPADSEGTRIFNTEDGSTIIQRSDGVFILISPEGVKTLLHTDGTDALPDGSCIVTLPNGTIVTIMPDGSVVTTLSEGAMEDSGEVEEGEESIEINPDISLMEGLKNQIESGNKKGAIELASLVAGLTGWRLADSSRLSSGDSRLDCEGFRRLEKGSNMRRFLRWSEGRFVKNGSEKTRKKMH
ncbi:MAG: hypothetical protein JW944_03965, partial [Deltaproteobacteria bacterium]|nr:hypothetical protein [Deltaproteobacteria bacterium]